MIVKKLIFVLLLVLSTYTFPQKYRIIESNNDFIKVEVDFSNAYTLKDTLINGIEFNCIKWDGFSFRNPGEPLLPAYYFSLGIPQGSVPQATVISSNSSRQIIKQLIPYQQIIDGKNPKEFQFDKSVYSKNSFFPKEIIKIDNPFLMRFARVAPIVISPYQYNPVTRELIFNSKVIIQIKYNNKTNTKIYTKIEDKMTEDFLNTSVINSPVALNWVVKEQAEMQAKGDEPYWYSSSKEYYKLFLNVKGVYRVTYEDIVQAGLSVPSLSAKGLELICNGKQIPIDIFTKTAKVFGPGDYFQFVGFPAQPTPYAKQNIYNTTNVYWFSYQSDEGGLHFETKEGEPGPYDFTYRYSPVTLHFEQDKRYEPFGYAPDDKRDFWQWAKVTGANKQTDMVFYGGLDYPYRHFVDSAAMTLRVNMAGLTNNNMVDVDHNAKISINTYTTATQYKRNVLGHTYWDGQTEATFERKFYSTADSIKLNLYNEVEVSVDGDLPGYTNMADEIRVNWYELDYWKYNMAELNHYTFINPKEASGNSVFNIWEWKRDNMTIYIPEKGKVIRNPKIFTDEYSTVIFQDSCVGQVEYFCVANDYFFKPDSIKKNVPSDLRSIQNGADILVIAHPKFMAAAERYANFRTANFPDKTNKNPRIKIVDVFKIYDEFSYGLLDPFALSDFTKYAFKKWGGAPFQYIVLFGDMSWNYRQLPLPAGDENRPNFVPSIPYQAYNYGRAASDNMMACVSGDDIVPDVAIGRISCETTDEANILIDKIVNYPADNTKAWKQNILLVSSGKDQKDEDDFYFNLRSSEIEKNILQPNGFKGTKIMRFPGDNPSFTPYLGAGPEIRAAIDKGAAMVNFYGHGGGYQWDFVFTDDAIPQLQNGNMLPIVTSVTCYTAHFDNQTIFGEIFSRIPGKGCVGFWGSSGLTYWDPGRVINDAFYNEIFTKRNYIVGDAILNAKASVGATGQYEFMVALLTYLGDPALTVALPTKPDFEVKSSDISISPENPIVGDTVKVTVTIRNLGTTFLSDTLTVQLFANGTDSLSRVAALKVSSFALSDTLNFSWIPKEGRLYNLIVNINNINVIPEGDFSDNTANASFAVYNIADPNFIAPINGFSTSKNQVDYVISDAGYYVSKNLTYFVEIDTSMDFNSIVQASAPIVPADGLAKWKSNPLPNGIYFWHSRINDGTNYGRWSPVRTFTITAQPKEGYTAANKQLKFFKYNGADYSESDGKLVLNTQLKSPYPGEGKYLDDINFDIYSTDSTSLTTLTSDGSYFYFATYVYYNPIKVSSRIYKLGTGYNGTTKGRFYGTVPNFNRLVTNSIFYHKDGFLYASVDNNVHTLLKINPQTGDTVSVFIPEGLINKDKAISESAPCYLTSDGTYVYNIAVYDKDINKVYTVRTFDPAKNWARVGSDKVLNGISYGSDFTGFFVCDGYLYTSETLLGGHLKRFRLSDGAYEEEWFLFNSANNYLFSWWYDWTNNVVYAGSKRYAGESYLHVMKFVGRYTNSRGNIVSQDIGPGRKWQSVSFDVDTAGSLGNFTASLEAYDKIGKKWDTVAYNIPKTYSLQAVNPLKYDYLRFNIDLVDSSKTTSAPLKFKNLNVNYTPPGEIILRKNNVSFTPDTVLQGFKTTFSLKAENEGYTDIDSVRLDCYLNGADSAFYSPVISIKKDSSNSISNIINSTYMLPSHEHTIKIIAKTNEEEYFSNNNVTSKSFYIARDSINPKFSITYDGREILDNDVISSRPKIIMSLTDEGPLPLRKGSLSIVHSSDVDKPTVLDTLGSDILYAVTEYPNTRLEITWTPQLKDGRHFLEIIGKDASGNLFDTVSYKKVFYVYNKSDIRNVYNYPNPFKNDTYFTFDLFGASIPEELYIKIYTVAGRLIKTTNIRQSQIRIGFNKIYWDGRDQDGDELANGLYFYKIVYKNNELLRTEIQKLAKIK